MNIGVGEAGYDANKVGKNKTSCYCTKTFK